MNGQLPSSLTIPAVVLRKTFSRSGLQLSRGDMREVLNFAYRLPRCILSFFNTLQYDVGGRHTTP
jgi:hypothetical protein